MSLNDGLSNRVLFSGGCSASSGVKHATYEMKVKSRNMGILTNCSATEPSSPQRLETVGHGDGIRVVVGDGKAVHMAKADRKWTEL